MMDTIILSQEITAKLLQYQIPHTTNIAKSLKKFNRAIDASDTGSGKSYCALAACAALNLLPLIICPKSVISSWITVCEHFNITPYGITNYETLHNCKMYISKKCPKVDCPYVKREAVEGENGEFTFTWKNLPDNILVIFDEAHRCKNPKTLNSVLLYTLSKHAVKILLLSATIVEKPKNFALFGYVLGLYKNIRQAPNWLLSVSKNYPNVMAGVHSVIFPDYCSRIRITELGSLFPNNQVTALCYDMDSAEEIQKQYKLIEDEVSRLKNKEESSGCALARIMYCRMKIEQLKAPTYINEAKKYIKEGNAVAVFVNFTQTLKLIADELQTNCVIHGQQTLDERDKAIRDFNSDKSHIIVCNLASGGVGISLHDLHGNFPRVTILSPGWNASQLIQGLGRAHRANGKTPVRQRILFASGTIEEEICENIKDKIINIAMLNDSDMDSYCIQGLIDEDDMNMSVGIDKNGVLSEFDKVFMRINSLNVKKQRLEEDLKETDEEIKLLEELMHKLIS